MVATTGSHVGRVITAYEQERGSSAMVRANGSPWRIGVQSWTRCIDRHRLDPSRAMTVPVLPESELLREREALGSRMGIVVEELQTLFQSVGSVGYALSFASSQGVVLWGCFQDSPELDCGDDRLGSVWREEFGGTNGLGTTLAEGRPTAVFLDDHFFPDLVNRACLGVPVFDPSGGVLGVVNLSTRNPILSQDTHRLAFEITAAAGRRLESRLFRLGHESHFVLRVAQARGDLLFACDQDLAVIAANQAANALLARLRSAAGEPVSLWRVFEQRPGMVERLLLGESPLMLRLLSTGQQVAATVAAPAGRQAPTVHVARRGPRSRRADGPLGNWAGAEPRLQRSAAVLQRSLDRGLPILILGETGVGKEVLAQAIHAESRRSRGPFVAFNCAAVPESLIDSELFGYASGAFTGARREGAKGRVLEADGGTLFLDEIGDMPLTLQTRLLRVLETGEVAPLGSGQMRKVDIQIVAATHQNLQKHVGEGRFRADLFFRLAGLVVEIPPLRDRHDFDELANAILAEEDPSGGMAWGQGTLERLRAHPWPGNIRELRFAIRRAVSTAPGDRIEPDDLMLHALPSERPSPGAPGPARAGGSAKGAAASAECHAIQEAIDLTAGDVEACLRILGISRASFYRKVKRFELALPRRGARSPG